MSDNPHKQDGIQSHITDSKELTEARRIRALLERRERVIDSLEAVSMAQIQDETKASEARLVFVSHLRSLILDLYPLLIDNGMLDSGESIGSFHVDPPGEVPQSSTSPELRAGVAPPKEESYSVDSLEWFTDRTFPITVEWDVEYAGQRGSKSVTKDVVPPVRICIGAMKRAMDCMAQLKIDIEAHEDKGTFGFDYDEFEEHGEE